jgi:hypothetical protein
METIRSYAFSGGTAPNPTDPIIVHLRIKSNNQEMYSNLASILKSYDDILLGMDYSFENSGHNLGSVPLITFRNKVIIVVDKINNSFLQNQAFLEYVNITSNSIFMKQPTAVQMQTHECKEDAFDLSIVEHELRQAVETELGGQLEILSSDAFRNLINVCVCGQPELLALFIDMALSLQSATHQQVVNYSSSGLWSKFPQAVDYAHVAAAFDALNTEGKPENLTNCPHFLRFIMLITPAMQLPERNDVGDEKQTEPVDVNDEMVVA